jgi:hypothetical protein
MTNNIKTKDMSALSNTYYPNPASEMALLLSLGYAILDNQNLHIRMNIPKTLKKSEKIPGILARNSKK